ncbi:hypothetical protein [Robiginitalea sediminis]|uniref:hypothetical protein n=1 Tax=Robiginitalea sediminis TaxID=1982593 RepID=UPI000B4ADE51|nr:hypothetical protein [Robiginitalea sediminis]
MSRFLSLALAFLTFFIQGCREAETYEKNTSASAEWAGQYLLRTQGQDNPNVTERYVLATSGQAEHHTLRRNGRFSEYHLEKIRRGRWLETGQSLEITLEAPGDSIRETYHQTLRSPDSTRTDTLWDNGKGSTLQRLVKFR